MPRVIPKTAAELIALINTKIPSTVASTPLCFPGTGDRTGAFHIAKLAERSELPKGKTLDIDLANQPTNVLTKAVDKAANAGRFK